MTQYEMLVVLPGTLSETEAEPVIQTIKETSERYGATELKLHAMGKSRLAYPMKHIRYGYFYIVQFAADSAAAKEIQSRVRLLSNILRLVFRTEKDGIPSDLSKLTLTPLSAVVNVDENGVPVRDAKREAPRVVVAPVAEVVAPKASAKAVSMEEIEEKLDQMLDQDLAKV